jgi:hypothetical protein
MSEQRPAVRRSRVIAPWRPLTVSILAFALPAGGAMLTVRNLERLQQLTPQAARRLLYLIVAVFAIGLSLLVLVAQRDKSGQFVIDSDALLIVSAGVATASYLAQRAPFRLWQSQHPTERGGSLLEAIWLVIVYNVVSALLALPLVLIAAQLSGGNLALTPG